jgi:hypothetical protein
MPVATVKDSSLHFLYEDSGPLGGLYTTLVMVHGTGFHSGKSYDIFDWHLSSPHKCMNI